jgi:asparagine synthase (glutamine-hydrolysing)
MCGIAGLVRRNGAPAERDALERMAAAIAHRGPDGDGFWLEGEAGLAHRRLAILDLSDSGRQPMASASGRWQITYNGELYNYRELRQELESLGHRFVSTSDTEVFLAAFAQWRFAAFARFNGMFAAAIWDRNEKTLTLVRDRIGVKPLYYRESAYGLEFGSEQKAFLARGDERPGLDPAALFEYFTFQNIFTDRTLLKEIRLLPAGCYAVLDARGGFRLRRERYWDFRFEAEAGGGGDREAATEELRHLIRQAVTRQLVADVEVGTYLSGGIDSGTVASIAAAQLPGMKSFTCGFDVSSASGIELSFDERRLAEAMSAVFGTEHYEIVLKAGDMERAMGRLAWHVEEPRVGQSYPNFYVAKLAGKFVKVVLSGAGGDELFGGYPWRYFRASAAQNFGDYVQHYYSFWQRLLSDDERRALFAPMWDEVRHVSTVDIFRDVFPVGMGRIDSPEDSINHSLYFEAKTFLHGLLVVEDKLGMAHGLETRYPFLDNDLIDFAMRCPVSFKLNHIGEALRLNENEPGDKPRQYFQRTSDGKRILRDAIREFVPEAVFDGAKQGFSAPDASWFKGQSIEYVKSQLLRPTALINRYFDPAVVRDLVGQHLSGAQNRRLFIWSLLSFEHWLAAFHEPAR